MRMVVTAVGLLTTFVLSVGIKFTVILASLTGIAIRPAGMGGNKDNKTGEKGKKKKRRRSQR